MSMKIIKMTEHDDDIYYFRIDTFKDDYKHADVHIGQTTFVKGKKNLCKRLIEAYVNELTQDEMTICEDDQKKLSEYFVMSQKYHDIDHIKPEYQEDLDALAKYHEILKKAEFVDECISYEWGKVVIDDF